MKSFNLKKRFSVIFFVSLSILLNSCAHKETKPNVLFIAIDDLRPELGCYGEDHVISPNIDRLAEQGVQFDNAYCQTAVCNPSRASLMTGLRPDHLKTWDLATHFRDYAPDVLTIPQYFRENGYYAAAIGKIFHNVIPDTISWSEPRFQIRGYPFDADAVYRDDHNVQSIEERKTEIIKQGKEKRYIDRIGEWYLKAESSESPDVPDNAYFDGAQTDFAVNKLKELESSDKPFFFAVGYYRPHLPFNAPKKYWDLYKREQIPLPDNQYLPKNSPPMAINNLRELRGYTDLKTTPRPGEGSLNEAQTRKLRHGYFASVSYIDAQVGRLLKTLDDLGLAENTIVVLWGDHGWKLGEHNSWCKMTNYEIDTRVPLIIRSPGLKKPGEKIEKMVEFVDVYPTLCELAGLPVPETLEGISAVPLINNPNQNWKKAVFSQFLREGIWLAPDGKEYMGYSIRTDRYRYVEWYYWNMDEKSRGDLAARELYDHSTDPEENINIASDLENEVLLNQLADQLKAGWQAARP